MQARSRAEPGTQSGRAGRQGNTRRRAEAAVRLVPGACVAQRQQMSCRRVPKTAVFGCGGALSIRAVDAEPADALCVALFRPCL